MRRTDLPYVISILIGTVLGVAVFFFLAPRLKPQEVTPAPTTGRGTASRHAPVQVEGRRPAHPRAIALGTQSAPVTQQDRSRARQTERRLERVRPRGPGQAPNLLAGATPPSQDEQGPLYIVYVGPVSEPEQAAEIVKQLALAGHRATVTGRDEARPPHFRVISEAVPLRVAERRVAVLTELGFRSRLRRLAGSLAQLRFEAFASHQEAEALARRVRTTGYSNAAVVREGGTVYVVTLGPHPQTVVDAITGTLRVRFRALLPVIVIPVD